MTAIYPQQPKQPVLGGGGNPTGTGGGGVVVQQTPPTGGLPVYAPYKPQIPSPQPWQGGGGGYFGPIWNPPPEWPPKPTPAPEPEPTGPQLDIETSINPRPVFDSNLTQQLINQRRAGFHQQANTDFMMKQLGGQQGVGRSGAHLSAISGPQSQLMAQAAAAAPATQWEDSVTNAESILRGQTERESEALGQAKPLIELALGKGNMNAAQQAMLIGLLGRIFPQLFGGTGGGSGGLEGLGDIIDAVPLPDLDL